MVVLWCWAIVTSVLNRQKLAGHFRMIAISCLAYGVAMEFVQEYLVSNRSFDVYDIVADAVGCVAGWIFSWQRYIKK